MPSAARVDSKVLPGMGCRAHIRVPRDTDGGGAYLCTHLDAFTENSNELLWRIENVWYFALENIEYGLKHLA